MSTTLIVGGVVVALAALLVTALALRELGRTTPDDPTEDVLAGISVQHLAGHEAISHAERAGLPWLFAYADADADENAARRVTVEEAKAIAAKDPDLIFVNLLKMGA